MEYKLGIDLSTTNIGLCLMTCNNKLIKFELLKLEHWSEKNMFYNLGLINKTLMGLINGLGSISIGVELSNFKNPLLTNRFSIYYGAILEMCRGTNQEIEIKCFNSNQWQRLVGCSKNDKREVCKEKAKEFALKQQLPDNLEQDIYDAFCITYFLEQLESTEQIKERVVKTRTTKKKNMSKINQLQQKIMTRYAYLKILDSEANFRKIARIENEIKEIEQEIRKLKNGD